MPSARLEADTDPPFFICFGPIGVGEPIPPGGATLVPEPLIVRIGGLAGFCLPAANVFSWFILSIMAGVTWPLPIGRFGFTGSGKPMTLGPGAVGGSGLGSEVDIGLGVGIGVPDTAPTERGEPGGKPPVALPYLSM